MGTKKIDKTLIAIVGETASGKSKLALKIAMDFNGEIVSADSRTIYKHMDIGTSKPSQKERQLIKHHLIDIRYPNKPITVAEYKKLADRAINSIIDRGKLPILVGGSGLYVDAVLFNYAFANSPTTTNRAKLNNLSVEDLQQLIISQNLSLPTNSKNKRHLVRYIETSGHKPVHNKLRPNTLVIGIRLDRDKQKVRINNRVEKMIKKGLEDEAIELGAKYGWHIEPMLSIGYREFSPEESENKSIDTTVQSIIKNTNNYSRRQRTWFKRNINIQWVNKQREAVDLITTYLSK